MARTAGAGGLVDALQQRDLVGLGHLVGEALDRADAVLRLTGQRDDVGAAAALAGGRRRSLGGGTQTGLAEVGGVGEPGGVALDDADAGAAVAAAGDLLDPAVVERRPIVDRLSSANTSANSPPVRIAVPSTRSRTSDSTASCPAIVAPQSSRRSSVPSLPRTGQCPMTGGSDGTDEISAHRRAPMCRYTIA